VSADSRSAIAAALADRYELVRELGRGGMATVYLANDLRHDRPVALKVLHPQLAATLGPERFLREIKLAARLQHPHVLTVLDSGEAAGQLWFTMPFIEGESLRDRLTREKQLPVEDALRMAREAADGLEYAHRHGVIHRDIKPENILLSDNHALVADFGIARALSGSEHLTETGMAIGTPAYMSPEQAAGERDLDARTDVYSLGSVLFEMLAGEPPFTGPTAQAIAARRLTGDVPNLRQLRTAVPESVERAVRKALAAVPADRFASAADFARALAPTAEIAPPATTVSPVAPRPAHRHRSVVLLGLGFLLGLGVLFGWLRRHGGEPGSPGSGEVKRLAVLPFDNLGAPDDEYFADGITDEVRGKLATLPGLQVIAGSSAGQYKRSTKSPQQIAQELGVQYLLIGKIRWEKSAGGQSRVRVSPELVQVAAGAAPTTKWQEPFDASLTDVFQVQADIAGRVADALDLALGDSARRALTEKPTQNLAAYDAFLRGEEVSQSLNLFDPPTVRRAAAYYAQAVALDSAFVQAWAQLSRAHSSLYFNSTPTPAEDEQARRAAERALAITPGRPEGHLAMCNYYWGVVKDNAPALEECERGLKLAPNDVNLLTLTALTEKFLGRWEAALVHLKQAQRLEPRSVAAAAGLTEILFWQRRYAEARVALGQALSLDPGNLYMLMYKAMIAVADGDLVAAKAVVTSVAKTHDPGAVIAFFAVAWDLFWLLDEGQQASLLDLAPSRFDNDRGMWGIVLAQTYWLRGERTKAQIYADSARIAFKRQLQAAPQDAQRHVMHGLVLAYLGQKTEAVREGERGAALSPIEKDAFGGAYLQHQLARIYLLVGEPDKALDQLEPLLNRPYYLSPAWLKIDPTFDPLRKHPRFDRLVKGDTRKF
jgi:eukaryotic-like serine/threonine-protein kinase